jgi:hypothetical protein
MTAKKEAAILATAFSPRPINYPTERGSGGSQSLTPACNLSNGTGSTHLSRVRAGVRARAPARACACDNQHDPVPLEKKQVDNPPRDALCRRFDPTPHSANGTGSERPRKYCRLRRTERLTEVTD